MTLPRCVREDLDARPGDKLYFVRQPDGRWLVKREARSLLELFDELRPQLAGELTLEEAGEGWGDD